MLCPAPLVFETPNRRMPVAEMKGDGIFEDAYILDLAVHCGFIELLHAQNIGNEGLHGYVLNGNFIASAGWSRAVPRTFPRAVFEHLGLAAVICAAPSATDKARELVIGVLVRIRIFTRVTLTPESPPFRCPPVLLGTGFPLHQFDRAIDKVVYEGFAFLNDYLFDTL